MALQQKYLNVPIRGEGYLEMIMYTPDTSIAIASVTSDDVLSYSDIQSISNLKNYSSTTIATLEENLWVLNGTFINPVFGRTYPGYVSNSVSDENGEFETNPVIDIGLVSSSNVETFTVILNPAVQSAYPKQMIARFMNGDTEVSSITKNLSDETTRLQLPNVEFEANVSNITNVKVEFVGTSFKHRRIRVSSVMFGKAIALTDEEILNSDYYDKCSFVPDSIPSRTFTFSVNNYSKKYNIDNPNNGYIDLDRQTRLLLRSGYNIYGYDETEKEINNPEGAVQIEWDDWKELRLLDIQTNNDDTATFSFGSILDMMTDTYTAENFENDRMLRYTDPSTGYDTGVIVDLLNFMGLPLETITFSRDDSGVPYNHYKINTPLPELPVRELIQLLAFSVGATLLIKDDGTIKFANLDLNKKSSFTNQHSFTYTDFVSVPEAQQLENTTKVSLPKYNSTIGDELEDVQTVHITASATEISYSECKPERAYKKNANDSGTILYQYLYCRKGNLICNLVNNDGLDIVIKGYKIDTKVTQDRDVTKDTLIIDTKLMKEDPNNIIKAKYTNWYSKKFKYIMQTRGEVLVDAGDWCEIQSPFTPINEDTGLPEGHLNTFVLSNHIQFDGAWSGEMEVVAL